MGHLMVQHAFKSISGMPEDDMVNTFHFQFAGTIYGSHPAFLENAVMGFYNLDPGTTGDAVLTYMGTSGMAAPRHAVKVYNMGDPAPRIPVLSTTSTSGTANATQQLPQEVAACLSFKAVDLAGSIPSRRRGRVYIGPLNVSAIQPVAGLHGSEVNFVLQQSIVESALDLANACIANTTPWCVFSPTTKAAGGTEAEYLLPVKTVWCDDAFDTVRSRGRKPLARLQGIVP